MGVTNTAIDNALNTIFPTSPNTWYMGLINNSPSPVLAPSDTLASHSGWSEAVGGGTNYSGNRPLWTNGASSSQQVTNASPVQYIMAASVSIYGIFLCSVATGSVGTLWCTGPFIGGPQPTISTDVLDVTLTVGGASS